MAIVVATRLKAHSWRHTLWFSLVATPSNLQAQRARGFVAGKFLWARSTDIFTVTLWEDGRSMQAFRNQGPHGRVMATWPRYGPPSTFAAWKVAGTNVPSWREVGERMAERARWADGPELSGEQLRVLHPLPPARGVSVPMFRLRRRTREHD